MSPSTQPWTSSTIDDSRRYATAQRATWVSAAVNVALTVAQILIGWLAHSQSLIAHGLHSFSDLLSDFLVLFANRQSRHPADAGHPYGHARIETAATLILGVSLFAVGSGILWDAAGRLQRLASVEVVALPALWVAIATVVAKEALYRYLIAVADRLRSQLLAANALHTRADAASALVVVVGIGGSLAGWRFLDLVAAILMGFMILKLGAELAWGALRELVDTGLEGVEVTAIRKTLAATPGVLNVHDLRTRRMAHRALVDAHVQVDGRISVSEGHRIAEEARQRVLVEHPKVLEVLVHVDPEADFDPRLTSLAMPVRGELQAQLRSLLAGLPPPERIVLHYLGGRVEAEVFLPASFFSDAEAPAEAAAAVAERVRGHPVFRTVSLNFAVAPK